MSSISPHSQLGSFMMFFFRIYFDVEKNNLVVGVNKI